MNKIAIFVDVQNIYYTTRQAFNKQFNYRAFWQQANTLGQIKVANAYAIDKGDTSQQKFQSALRHIGFEVKLKPYIQRSDGSAKGDWDVGITIDVLETAKHVDEIILLSGDGDFDLLLLAAAKTYGCTTRVFSVEQLSAKSLLDAAEYHQPIDNRLLL